MSADAHGVMGGDQKRKPGAASVLHVLFQNGDPEEVVITESGEQVGPVQHQADI